MRKVNKFKTLSIVMAIVAMTISPSLLIASVGNPKSPLQARILEKKEIVSDKDRNHLTPLKGFEGTFSFVKKETDKIRMKAPKGSMCNYTLEVTFDANQYIPQGGGLVNQDYTDEIYGLDENGFFDSKVPSGEYSVLFLFKKISEIGEPLGTVFFIKDHVKVSGEETKINVNPDDATQHLHFMPIISNGAEVQLSKLRKIYDSDYNEIGIDVLQQGNTDFIAFATGLWNNKLGPIFTAFGSADGESELIVENTDVYYYVGAPTDVWITDIDEEWMIIMNSVYGSGETLYYTTLIPENFHNQNVVNDKDKFSEFIFPTFQQSYWGASQEHQPPRKLIDVDIFPEYEGQMLSSPDYFNTPYRYYYDKYGSLYNSLKFSETSNESIRSKINNYIRFIRDDAVISYSADTIWWDNEHYEIEKEIHGSYSWAPPFYLTNHNTRAVYNMLELYFFNSNKDTELDLYNRCWHPWLPIVDQMPNFIYSSTPRYLMSFISGNHNRWTNHGLGLCINPANDYYGGGNATFYIKSNWDVEYNGEKLDIFNYQEDIEMWGSDRGQQQVASGEYKITFTTPEDRVGGLKSNTTLVACFDQRKADCTAPAIQLLNFVDADNNFSHEFSTPEEGKLRFVGGDFDWDNETDMPYSKDCEIIVEVSPYTTDNWEKLTANRVEVEAPKYFAPAYEVPLEGVTAKSTTGWFDLRITMTDADGNYMSQTISPAFKIDSLTGIDSTFEGVSKIRIEGRNIIAPAGARIFSINGTPVSGTNLQPGIYFVTLSDSTRKVLIK